MAASHPIAAVTGFSFIVVFVVACSLLFGVQLVLVQIAESCKSKAADMLIGWYVFICGCALVGLLLSLLVWSLFRT